METTKTAEEILEKHFNEPHPAPKWLLDAMEEYASIKAEQASREERERHKFLIEEVDRAVYVLKVRYSNPYPALVSQLDIHLAAAGYGKEGK